MQKSYLLLILILTTISCNQDQSILLNPESVNHYKDKIEYDYSIEKKVSYDDNVRLIELEFYKEEKLIEEMWGEFHAQHFYNTEGQLIKINHCRFHNCNAGIWEFIKYDENKNPIGSLRTLDSLADIDTANVLQNRFYDSQNRLIKELIRNSNIL